MPQIFYRSFNVLSRVTIFGAVFIAAGLSWFAAVIYRSSYVTESHIALVQPVPFSHAHHAGQLGIDCRYCHTSVETSAFAGIPPTKTCMNCHQQIWVGSSMLEPVRESYRTGKSIPWQRVHNLPGLRLLRSQHSRSQGRRLRLLSWPCRRNAADLSGEHAADGVVPGVPSQSRNSTCGRSRKSSTWPGSGRSRPLGENLLDETTTCARPHELTSCSTCHR